MTTVGRRTSLDAVIADHRAAGHDRLDEADGDRFAAIRQLLPEPPATILDVGCGVGALGDWLSGLGYQTMGIDRDASLMVRMSSPHQQASITEIPFADSAFDVVVASEVLEHLPVDVYDTARHELARTARASIIITVPNAESLESASTRCPECLCVYSIHGHVRRFDPVDMETLIPGWKLESLGQVGPFKARHRSIEWLLRRRLLGRWPAQPGAVCPQCGYRQPTQDLSGRASRVGRLARSLAGAPWRQRWHLVAQFSRATSHPRRHS